MNKNIPHAVRVIRATLASSGSDPATAIAHALNSARLLVDPESSRGIVLHRTPAGGWSREPQQMTELERQALAWERSCERARLVAVTIERHIGQHPEFQSLRADGDRILVALHVTDQGQWAQWRTYFGITDDGERPLPYAVTGEGHRDGVHVSVVAYDVPQVRAHAQKVAARPFQLGGVVYDLALPQRDVQGGVWYFHGAQTPEGMPLLSMDGRQERCSLANVVEFVGPLTAVKPSATPVIAGGGEAA
ncbi:BN159_2729 family protein [Streptomyces sp. CA-288835]|uniref:BN159_2729 family protein n=1 Tax=Streptomyces sp. CA-288835 TaxID=3240069 RepID=UPI003D92BE94